MSSPQIEVKIIPHHAIAGGTCHVVEPHVSREYFDWWYRMGNKYFKTPSPEEWTIIKGAGGPYYGYGP